MSAQGLTRLLMLVATLAPSALAAQSDCGSLAALKLPHTSITVAQSVAPGALTQPPEKFDMTNGTYDKLPAFCRVAGVIQPSADSNIRFEVWMPAQNWNHKFEGVGKGQGSTDDAANFACVDPPSAVGGREGERP